MNAKMRRTGVCGAAETLLIDRAVAKAQLPTILAELHKAGCEIRGDETVRALDPAANAATEQDWFTEFLDAILAVRVVDGLDAAIDAHQPLRLASHRRDRHRGRCRRRDFP